MPRECRAAPRAGAPVAVPPCPCSSRGVQSISCAVGAGRGGTDVRAEKRQEIHDRVADKDRAAPRAVPRSAARGRAPRLRVPRAARSEPGVAGGAGVARRVGLAGLQMQGSPAQDFFGRGNLHLKKLLDYLELVDLRAGTAGLSAGGAVGKREEGGLLEAKLTFAGEGGCWRPS